MILQICRRSLEVAALLALGLVVMVPLIDFAIDKIFWRGIPQADEIGNQAILVLAFATSALASLDKKQLSLADLSSVRANFIKYIFASIGELFTISAQISLFWISSSFALTGFNTNSKLLFIPFSYIALIIPLCFALMTYFTIHNIVKKSIEIQLSSFQRLFLILIPYLGIIIGSLLVSSSIGNILSVFGQDSQFLVALIARVQDFCQNYGVVLALISIITLLFGTPIFAVIGFIAIILFASSSSFLELIPSEAYSLLQGGTVAALPLFSIAGILLASSGAGTRFVAVFKEFFGWFRGGEVVAAVLASAVFSTFTGINGVTILALGTILATVLIQSAKMKERNAHGLITSSGDIGLLLPPSAAVIIYAVNAQFIYPADAGFSIIKLFKGAFLPGLIIIFAMCVVGYFMTPAKKEKSNAFSFSLAAKALKPAALELLTPILAIVLFFTGLASLREIAAISILYIVIIEWVVKKEFSLKSLFAHLGTAFPIIGGTLIIIAIARGLSFYIIDADIPTMFATWITNAIHSKFLFLLLMNLFLLAAGFVMEIFSAIFILAPLLIPLGISFGIDPVQFGVIFITNLLIGFIHPPVGMNLFLASYAFKIPLSRITVDVLPFLGVQLLVLFLVTYIPEISTLIK